MSFGHWLKGATRVRIDGRTGGNLLKNAAVAGGTALGGVGGLALAGLGSAAGQKALGGSWGDAAGAGLKGASAAGGLSAARGLATKALSSGAGAAAGAPATTSVATAPAYSALDVAKGGALMAKDAASNVGGGVLGFVKDNPTAAAMGLQAVGGMATAGSQNRAATAQADILEQQAGETAYDFARRKERDQQLAPVWSSLGTAIGKNYNAIGDSYGSVAANPYLPKVG